MTYKSNNFLQWFIDQHLSNERIYIVRHRWFQNSKLNTYTHAHSYTHLHTFRFSKTYQKSIRKKKLKRIKRKFLKTKKSKYSHHRLRDRFWRILGQKDAHRQDLLLQVFSTKFQKSDQHQISKMVLALHSSKWDFFLGAGGRKRWNSKKSTQKINKLHSEWQTIDFTVEFLK